MTVFANPQETYAFLKSFTRNSVEILKEVLKDQSTEKLFQLCPTRHTCVNMQTLKNDFATVKRKGFPFYSPYLQLSSSESLYPVCSDPNTAHRSTQLQPAE